MATRNIGGRSIKERLALGAQTAVTSCLCLLALSVIFSIPTAYATSPSPILYEVDQAIVWVNLDSRLQLSEADPNNLRYVQRVLDDVLATIPLRSGAKWSVVVANDNFQGGSFSRNAIILYYSYTLLPTNDENHGAPIAFGYISALVRYVAPHSSPPLMMFNLSDLEVRIVSSRLSAVDEMSRQISEDIEHIDSLLPRF